MADGINRLQAIGQMPRPLEPDLDNASGGKRLDFHEAANLVQVKRPFFDADWEDK